MRVNAKTLVRIACVFVLGLSPCNRGNLQGSSPMERAFNAGSRTHGIFGSARGNRHCRGG